ncbi:outer membrane protein assembly factor BamB family protein [Kitasatospora sp. P5_F3]
MFADAVPVRVRREGGLWTLTAPPDTLSRPVVRGNRVFVLVDGRPVACDRADGTVVWQSPHRVIGEQDFWEAGLTATGGHLVVPTARTDRFSPRPAALSVLEAESGSLLWKFDPGELAEYRADRETLVVWHGRVGGRPIRLTGFDLTTGSRLWEHAFESVGTMQLVAGRVIASVKDAQGYAVAAFDARSGAELWRRSGPSGILCVPNNGARTGPPLVFVWSWTEARLLSVAVADGATVGDFSISHKDQQYKPLIIDGGRTVWVAAPSRAGAVHSFRPGTPAKEPSHTFHSVRYPLSLASVPIAPVDGWLYAIDGGHRLLAAPIGSGGRQLLKPFRWPESVPGHDRGMEFLDGFTAGRNHVYARTGVARRAQESAFRRGTLLDDHLIALRHGTVLWRRPRPTVIRPVPTGDQVLLVEGDGRHDRLLLVDGDTGGTVEG